MRLRHLRRGQSRSSCWMVERRCRGAKGVETALNYLPRITSRFFKQISAYTSVLLDVASSLIASLAFSPPCP